MNPPSSLLFFATSPAVFMFPLVLCPPKFKPWSRVLILSIYFTSAVLFTAFSIRLSINEEGLLVQYETIRSSSFGEPRCTCSSEEDRSHCQLRASDFRSGLAEGELHRRFLFVILCHCFLVFLKISIPLCRHHDTHLLVQCMCFLFDHVYSF